MGKRFGLRWGGRFIATKERHKLRIRLIGLGAGSVGSGEVAPRIRLRDDRIFLQPELNNQTQEKLSLRLYRCRVVVFCWWKVELQIRAQEAVVRRNRCTVELCQVAGVRKGGGGNGWCEMVCFAGGRGQIMSSLRSQLLTFSLKLPHSLLHTNSPQQSSKKFLRCSSSSASLRTILERTQTLRR